MPTPKNIVGAMVVDKDGNKQTIMNMSNARRKTYAQYQQMSETQRKGVVIVEDYPIPEESDMVEVDGTTSMTYGEAVTALFNLVDFSKISCDSVFIMLGSVYVISEFRENKITFSITVGGTNRVLYSTVEYNNGTIKVFDYNLYTQTRTDSTDANMWTNGKVQLIYNYYNTLDIHTEYLAKNCYLADGTTVEDRIPASYEITLPTSGYTSGSVTIWGESLTLYSIVISTDKDGNPLTNFTSGMTEDYPINVSGSQTDFNKLYAFSIGNGNVTFYLTSAPSTAFNVLIKEAI